MGPASFDYRNGGIEASDVPAHPEGSSDDTAVATARVVERPLTWMLRIRQHGSPMSALRERHAETSSVGCTNPWEPGTAAGTVQRVRSGCLWGLGHVRPGRNRRGRFSWSLARPLPPPSGRTLSSAKGLIVTVERGPPLCKLRALVCAQWTRSHSKWFYLEGV